MRNLTSFALVAAWAMLGPIAVSAPLTPDAVDGLVAWYRAESLIGKVDESGRVTIWPDASASGRDLAADRRDGATVLEPLGANGRPAVRIGPRESFTPQRPIELRDHTIFVVCRTPEPQRALLRSADDDRFGIVLLDGGTTDRLQAGREGEGQTFDYSREQEPTGGLRIVTLARRKGRLYSWIDGVDHSAGQRYPAKLRVGRLFQLRHRSSRMGQAGGLRLAELAFYDRFLDDEEREALTAWLARHYGVAVEQPERVVEPRLRLSLGTTFHQEVDDTIGIAWDVAHQVDSPFRHDATEQPGRIYCTRNDVTAHVSVRLALESAAAGSMVRVLLLKNGVDYLPDEAISQPSRPGQAGEVILEASIPLGDGDYFEIVATPAGAPSRLLPDESSLRVSSR